MCIATLSVLHTHCQLSLLGNWPCQLRVVKEGIRVFRFGFLAFSSPLLVLHFVCLPASDCCLSMACSEKTWDRSSFNFFRHNYWKAFFFPLKSVTVLMTTHKWKSSVTTHSVPDVLFRGRSSHISLLSLLTFRFVPHDTWLKSAVYWAL
jgi:hypothetical protein